MRIVHKAKLISPEGDVSPVCAGNPRKVNMKKESWTTDSKAVTCKKCLAKAGE